MEISPWDENKDPAAEGQREEIKFHVLTELNRKHSQPYNYTARLHCVGYDYGQYQPSIRVSV